MIPLPSAAQRQQPNCRLAPPSLLSHSLTFLQVAVTVGLLWWLFHDPERRAVMGAALKMADWRWIVLAVAAAGICEFFGILRWQLFLRMLHIEVPLRETSRLFFIGAFFNQFLPGTTGGDVVRVIFLMRDHPENKAEGFLSVAVDRLLAVLVLVIMGLLFAWTRDDWFARSFAVGNLMKWFAITLFVMGAALVASFVLTSRHLVTLLPRKFPLRKQIIKLSRLWQLCLENRREALLGAIYTVPMLLAYFSAFCFAAKAFTDKVTFLGHDFHHAAGHGDLLAADQPQRDRCARSALRGIVGRVMRRPAGHWAPDLNCRHDGLSSLGSRWRSLLSGAHHKTLPGFKRNFRAINRGGLDVPPVSRTRSFRHCGERVTVA